ncbi:hypothetical protein MKX01_023122 [Papaver californicum]|nr:hypothetical protein MKX01_023122 [Papaver californicum]
MGRYRSRSRSYSPHRSPMRRKRYDDPQDTRRDRRDSCRSYRGGDKRSSSGPTGLLVRNISLDARVEDLRVPFERFGPVKDVYLPKNYYTGEPRGFGFVKFHDAEDAAEAKEQMDHQVIGGRDIRIVFAEENRKTPQEMRMTSRVSSDRYGGGRRRRSPPRSPRRRYRSYSRSPTPARRSSRYSRSPSPARRSSRYSRSPSPARRSSRYSPSPSPAKHDSRYSRSPSPVRRDSMNSPSPSPAKHDSRNSTSPSPAKHDSRYSRSPSPVRHGSRYSRLPSPVKHGLSRSRPPSPVRI